MLKIGHRGASGYAPENTLASFKRALQLGVDAVELDVHVLKDGTVVVMHDNKLDRTTNGKGNVNHKTYDEIKELDAGEGEKIPTLQEVLDLIYRKAQVHIELKGVDIAKPVAKIIKDYVAHKSWKYSDFLISSFNHDNLREFKNLLPEVKIGALIIGVFVRFDQYIKDFNPYSVHMYYRLVRKTVVEKAHKRGLKLFVYTVNDKKAVEKMRELGVDGIISDYPDRIV